MNICLNQDKIRIRITKDEFNSLTNNGEISYCFQYWPLTIDIIIKPSHNPSRIYSNKLLVSVTTDELSLLISPENLKNGLNFIANNEKNNEIIVDLQVDLKS